MMLNEHNNLIFIYIFIFVPSFISSLSAPSVSSVDKSFVTTESAAHPGKIPRSARHRAKLPPRRCLRRPDPPSVQR